MNKRINKKRQKKILDEMKRMIHDICVEHVLFKFVNPDIPPNLTEPLPLFDETNEVPKGMKAYVFKK